MEVNVMDGARKAESLHVELQAQSRVERNGTMPTIRNILPTVRLHHPKVLK